jgi:gluconate 2-dehydrogenase gamma chain
MCLRELQERASVGRSRRSFIGGLGALGAAAGLAPALAAVEARSPDAPPSDGTTPAEGYLFFRRSEAACVEAAVDRLVPADALTARGVALGLARFIDGQLAGPFGQGSKTYMRGPWQAGTPQQGWQLPLTPAAAYRAAIPRIDAHCAATYGGPFHQLSPERQDTALRALEDGGVDLVELPGHLFFRLLHQNTMEALFSDPLYGGNRGKLGWAMVGFPGARGNFVEVIEQYWNKPYPADPAAIGDE